MMRDARQRLLDRTDITNVAADSRASTLLELPLSEMDVLWAALTDLESNSFLSTASGQYLDAIGELVGIRRLPSRKADTIGPVFKFYLQSPRGTAVSVPSGTRVWTPDDPQVSFYTKVSVSIPANSLEVYTPIEAANEGSFYTAGAYTLTAHSINDVTLYCTNSYPVTSGRDVEPDENLRFRIAGAPFQWARGNQTAVRNGLLVIPGVRDVKVVQFSRGTGSLEVLVYSHYPTVSDELLARVQEELDERLLAHGVQGVAVAPTTVSVGIRASLVFMPDATVEQVGAGRRSARQAVVNYLNNLNIGQSAVMDQVERVMLNSSQYIQEVILNLIEVDDHTRPPENILVEEDERIIAGNVLIS
jgi:uncharacterized phage protein gp47/JayE